MVTQVKDLLLLLSTVLDLLCSGCYLLNLLLLLVSGLVDQCSPRHPDEGFVVFVACCLGFVAFWLLFVEFVVFVGSGPGWLVLSMATPMEDLLFLLLAVWDLLVFGCYLLNLLLLLVLGLARRCSLWLLR